MQECYSTSGISDHEIIAATVESEAFYNPTNSYKVYLWNSANMSELKESMSKFAKEFFDQFTVESCVESS